MAILWTDTGYVDASFMGQDNALLREKNCDDDSKDAILCQDSATLDCYSLRTSQRHSQTVSFDFDLFTEAETGS